MNIPVFKKKEKARPTKDELFSLILQYFTYCDVSEMKLIYKDKSVIVRIIATEIPPQR